MAVVPQSPNRIGGNIFTIFTNREGSITATAGGGQSGAYQLAAQLNRVTTVATAADSVKLPKVSAQSNVPGAVGWACFVHNLGASALQLFGYTPDTINGVATGTGISIGPGEVALCVPTIYTNSTDVGDWTVLSAGADAGLFSSLNVTGTTTLSGAVTMGSTLNVAGTVTVSGAATVAGAATLAGATSVGGAFVASSTAIIGGGASVKVGVHGTAGSSQAAALTAVSVSALVAVSGAYGFATEAQATALITAVNSIETILAAKGFTA